MKGGRISTPPSPYRFAWRAEFSNQSLNVLYAEAFHHAVLDYDWLAQVRGHSLGWVCAFDADTLIGFVNVAWDGDDHAFILDTAVLHRYERQGVGTRLVALASERVRAAGRQWLHVDFDEEGLGRLYFDACGFRPTIAGLIDLTADAPTITSAS
jgi:GNAT superfamily N-acetyltransferase